MMFIATYTHKTDVKNEGFVRTVHADNASEATAKAKKILAGKLGKYYTVFVQSTEGYL